MRGMARVGLLTGGGDCPGLNAVIRAVVRRGLRDGEHSVLGFRHGWAGVLSDDAIELTLASTAGILPRGGTILGTSRTNPFAEGEDERGLQTIRRTLAARGIDALIPIGGEDTLGVALRLHREGVPVVGVPKTIDNDLGGTDVTFGFQTAVQIVTDTIDRLHTTAESHNRVMVVEVMGRHAGWIATHARARRGRRRDPRAGAPVRHRGGVHAPAPPPRARAQLLDRGRRRGRHAARGNAADSRGRRRPHRRLRARSVAAGSA